MIHKLHIFKQTEEKKAHTIQNTLCNKALFFTVRNLVLVIEKNIHSG